MSGGRKNRQRKLSAGTVFMLVLLAAVLSGSALVLGKLSSGASVDLSKLHMSVLDIQNDTDTAEDESLSAGKTVTEKATAAAERTAPHAAPTPEPETRRGSFIMTLGGSIALAGEVRTNSKNTDAKVTDYSDIMMLLAPEIRGEVTAVFLENILSDKMKASDTAAPESAASLLKEAGFGMAACGFSQAYAGGADGITATLRTLTSQGIRPLGIKEAGDSSIPETETYGGVRTAILQYTDTVPSKTRRKMEKDGNCGMVPEAELSAITADIAAAREQGAEAVIVLISWGKAAKEPDKAQRALAEGIAMAGADLICGSGCHEPQAAEYLEGPDGKKVLCAWSLGTLLSGDRKTTRRLSGYLLHVTVRSDGNGGAEISDPAYTPVYTWKYKQDSRFYYRCVVSDREAPDGMAGDQQKAMAKSAEAVRETLRNSPLKRQGE